MTKKPATIFVLLPLLIAACGDGEGPPGHPTGTPPPDDLVGQWKTTLTYVPAYYAGAVGTGVGNGDFIGSLGITLYFSPSGAYQFELDTATTIGGVCFRTTVWTETGVVNIAGSDITFTSTHATSSILDSCGKAQYVDPAPTGSATYAMAFEQDQTGAPVLHLRAPTGEDIALGR